jgi:hypothetical protein
MKKPCLAVLALSVLLTLQPQPAAAGYSTSTLVIAVDVRADGTWLVDIAQPTTNAPPCVTSNSPPITTRLSGTSKTEGGKAMLQFAEAAFISGIRITVEGANTCNEYGGIESVLRIYAAR